jgi:hypothetical protein
MNVKYRLDYTTSLGMKNKNRHRWRQVIKEIEDSMEISYLNLHRG